MTGSPDDDPDLFWAYMLGLVGIMAFIILAATYAG
jgi:hypothetical protein